MVIAHLEGGRNQAEVLAFSEKTETLQSVKSDRVVQ